jgi:hypothetical protein
MTEPPRFSDGAPDDLGRSLFRALREESPPDDLEARTLAHLGLPLVPPPVPPAAPPTAPPLPPVAELGTSVAGTPGAVAVVFAKYFVASVVLAGAVGGSTLAVLTPAAPPPTRAAATSSAASPSSPSFRHADPPGEVGSAIGQSSSPTSLVPPKSATSSGQASSSPSIAGNGPHELEASTPPTGPASRPPPLDSATATPPLPSTLPPSVLAVPGTTTAPSVASSAAPPGMTTASGGPPPSIQAELATLDHARQALARGDEAEARRDVAAYRASYPRGQLGAEATVIEIEAISRAGDAATATRIARHFLQTNPQSPLAPRVRALTALPVGTATIP